MHYFNPAFPYFFILNFCFVSSLVPVCTYVAYGPAIYSLFTQVRVNNSNYYLLHTYY